MFGYADKTAISKKLNNTNFSEIQLFLNDGRSMEWIAEHYSIDLALAWAMLWRKLAKGYSYYLQDCNTPGIPAQATLP